MRVLTLSFVLALTLTGCSDSALSITAGGSQDVGLARDIIEAGLIPDQEHFTAEGLFSEHDLPLDGPACDEILCPRGAVTLHEPLDGGDSRALLQIGFGTNLDADSFERQPLDVSAVVDISCSMTGEKLETAQEALLAMLQQLDENDRMALVKFGARSSTVLRSRPMTASRKARMRSAIEGLDIGGSTSLEAGMERGFARLSPGMDGFEHRMMVFTDAQPNTGTTAQSAFVTMTREAADLGIGTTVFGTGEDLGSELADAISKVRGGSYHYLGEGDVERLFVDEFDYIVTPVGYDLEIVASPSSGLILGEVYGAPVDGDDVAMGASTLFVSNRDGGIAAVIDGLLPDEGAPLARLSVSWDPVGDGARVEREVDVAWQGGAFAGASDQLGVHKIALLVDEYTMLTAAAEMCDAGEFSEETVAIIEAGQLRLAEQATELSDGGLSSEAALMAQLLLNIEAGTSACAEADTYIY